MNHKVILLGLYVITFAVNLFTSIKYPDANIGIQHIAVSLVLFSYVLFFISKEIRNKRVISKLKIFLLLGAVVNIAVYVINLFEGRVMDLVANIQYPAFLLFTTPLFGLNMLSNLNVGSFSLIIALIYAVTIIFMKILPVVYKKKQVI
ncbi:hypothetical protein P9B03_19815 [Metasolibacillus meyeri]|uniref:Uncharacterized protein n=1 Tax=Metasolibacillus meyeri TaxID=1071052 RepID=A0AAW9NSP2_9BACL|nr:hypothetical protein [Metasolibacillus meyeri]MEC1180707.1 hypothetical protein [Metasolibacillus meyeri]